MGRVGVAVSGGSDSTALLLAAVQVARIHGGTIHAVTVDHGLRPSARSEIRQVAALCDRLGVAHHVVPISLARGANLQARAREARYDGLASLRWAPPLLHRMLLGHTADDAAETLVMRLSRAAGIDGLARMAERRFDRDVEWLRPALDVTRSDLRAALARRDVPWSDDPSNEDPAFARVAARQAIAALDLDVHALAASAGALENARASLVARACDIADGAVTEDRGDLLIDRIALRRVPDPDPAPRILLAALRHVGGRAYGPRRAERNRLVADAMNGRPLTLAGCTLRNEAGILRVAREATRAAPPVPFEPSVPWDGRWHLTPPAETAGDLTVGALGEDVTRTPWRDTGLPRSSLVASPAVRDGARLIAAPVAGLANGWTARTRATFTQTLQRR